MVDINKKTRSLEDRLNQLPDHLVSDKILSHLCTKDAVRTSVLSTKWRNLWKRVHALDLDSRAFSSLDAFLNFGDKVFDSHKESLIHKLRLSVDDYKGTKSHFCSWIDAVTKCKIQQLDVRFEVTLYLLKLPMSIYSCETLVQLRLCWVALVSAEFVSLPCLKVMDLNWVKCLDEDNIIQKLISSSPVLEDLTIMGCCKVNGDVIHVRSKTLKRIHIDGVTKTEIDAPLLQYLKTHVSKKKNFTIVSSGLLEKVDIQVFSTVFDKTVVSEILTDISKVRDLVIDGDMWKCIFLYLKSGSLLQLRHLSRLDARYHISDLELLPNLLESCPNLQSLILELDEEQSFLHTEEKEPNVRFSAVPHCLISSLKFVILKRPAGSIPEYEGEMDLVRYLLKNSRILEKLTLLFFTGKARSAILAMPRCSSACAIS